MITLYKSVQIKGGYHHAEFERSHVASKRSYLIGWQCVMGSWVCLELVIVAAFLQKDGCLPVVKPPKLASVGF